MIAAALTAPPAPAMARARRVAETLPIDVDVHGLVHARARHRPLGSQGQMSTNGSCRLLPTSDGWVAVNLPRPADRDALPAVVEAPVDPDDPWDALARFARPRPATAVVDRCRLLEVAAAVLDDPAVDASRATVVERIAASSSTSRTPLVVDLSSMWAGPLCAHLLGRTGMHVVKVESPDRPDGLRTGDPALFEELHAGHEQRRCDFSKPHQLEALLRQADVVIESSRPRALLQLGIDAREVVAAGRGRTWVSITGYGRTGDAARLVAFGDDAAVAGGLVVRDDEGRPAFCGDAIADPMTGLFAAAATHRSVTSGGGQLIAISMAGVAKALATGA